MSNQLFNKSLCALAVGSALIASPTVFAQQAAAEEDKGLEKIVVTARKTTESLQEVPVSVTSIGAMELSEKGISDITEIQQFSPNTTLQTSRGTNSTLTAFIRGVGQQDPLWGYEPGVGIYVDDVYVARPQGAVLDLLDVERIEVLRGPQGTLYGKNTVGGAVKYVTKPMDGDAQFNAQATLGSYSQRDIKVTGQLPILEDRLYLGAGYASLSRDGYGEFLDAPAGSDTENYNKDLWAARLSLEFQASDDVFIKLAWDKTEDESNSKGGYRLLPSILPGVEAPVPDSVYDSYTSLPTWNKVELEGTSLTIDWAVSDDLSLKYVAAKRESYSPTNIDFDNTGFNLFDVPAVYDDENTSHELQASYIQDGMTVVGGLYAYDSESCGIFDAILGGLGLTLETSGCNNSESYAAYVQTSIDLTDKWSLTAGARYTDEKKEASVFYGFLLGAVYPYSGWVDGYQRGAEVGVPQSLGTDTNGDGVLDAPKQASWSRFTPRLGVEYQYDADTLFFASYAQGFKSGTFNPRASTNERAADPEIADSVEFGMKKDWNANLRTNITLFWLDHKDRQYIVVEADPNDPTVLGQNLGNAAKSEVTGIEAEITYAVSDDLTLDLALGYLDAELEQDENITTPLVGLSNTPDMTFALSANYVMESDHGLYAFNAGYYYRDDYIIFEDNETLAQDGYGMFNASINWEHTDGHWYAGLHLKNITDEEYMVGGYSFVGGIDDDGNYLPGFGGDTTLVGYYGAPRTVSLTVGYRF